jgi:hypothetical protein
MDKINLTEIDIDHLDELPKEKILELINQPASMYDIANLRASNHRIGNLLTGYMGNFEIMQESIQRIEQSLLITLNNGKKTVRPLNQVVGEMYEREKPLRDKLHAKHYLRQYNNLFGIMGLLIVILSFIFHDSLNEIISFILKYKEPFISIIVFPLLFLFFKKLFTKKGV